ncbi:hypothetical protein BKA69DRAFT_1027557, partial [Paraphysoderma sedebokerense]
KYHCDACRKDVTEIARIKCAQCDDFDLCVECFSEGVEVGEHKNDHDYRVMDTLNFAIFTDDWGADEELLMMEGFEKYGMGNWEDVADHIGSKTKEEVEKHYYEVYVNSANWPLPTKNHHQHQVICCIVYRVVSKTSILTATIPYPEPATKKSSKPLASMPANHEVAGYMPGRKEFETEYELDSENYCKDIFFNEDDAADETELKLAVLDIYNRKLHRKAERKKFIFERGLLEYKKIQAMDKKRTKDERELYNRMRVFARMQTAEDFETLMDGLVNEIRLREKITQLQEYRRCGLTTLAQAQTYEKDRALKYNQKPLPLNVPSPLTVAGVSPSIRRATSQSLTTPSAEVRKQHLSPRPIGRRPANPLDISNAESVHLLTEREQQLCSTLRILPKSYLAIKETLIREYTRLGTLKRRQARSLIKIDVNKTGKIYDFFLEMGLLIFALFHFIFCCCVAWIVIMLACHVHLSRLDFQVEFQVKLYMAN